MKYKMLVLDIDGTLLNSKVILSPEVKKAINYAKQQGLIVTIATGRFYYAAVSPARIIGINAPLIANDGAQIQDVFTDKVYSFTPISLDTAREIVEAMEKYPLELQVFLKDRKIYAGKSYQIVQIKKYFRHGRRYNLKGFYNYVRDFVFGGPTVSAGNVQGVLKNMTTPPAKIVVYGDKQPLKELRNELTSRFKGRVDLTSAIPRYMDILPPGVSKVNGIQFVANMFNIKREEIIAVGDNFNDLAMIEYAGLGVAMGNAPESVKQKANFVTDSNDENGIVKVVKQFIYDYSIRPVKTGKSDYF